MIMSFFDQAYDEMSWEEVCYRLPSDLAVASLKRRVSNLDTIRMLFENVGSAPAVVNALKSHVNDILNGEDPDDILDLFAEDYEKVLFAWLDESNRKRVRDHDPDKLSLKFLFNTTDSDDKSGLTTVLDKVLAESVVNQSHLRAVLNKADDIVFGSMIDKIVRDSRPEVRVSLLSIGGSSNRAMISDHQRVMGLKALSKCSSRPPTMNILPIHVFAELRPLERLNALEAYFNYFPVYKKVKAFDPAPSKEEFDMILFAGCIEHNDRVTKLNEKYRLITEADPPKSEDSEEDQ